MRTRLTLLLLLLQAVGTASAALLSGRPIPPLFPPVQAAWVAALAPHAPLLSSRGIDLRAPEQLPSLRPVVFQLIDSLGYDSAAFEALGSQGVQALELALAESSRVLEESAQSFAGELQMAAGKIQAGSAVDRERLEGLVAHAREMLEYSPILSPQAKWLVAGNAELARQIAAGRIIGSAKKTAAALLAGSPASAEELPAAAAVWSGRAEKLLERMKATKSGWRQKDIAAVYSSFGFRLREVGPHIVAEHPDFPELRATISRQTDLPPGYAQTAVKDIARLKVLLRGTRKTPASPVPAKDLAPLGPSSH